jgi:hypothetical protein
VTGALDSIDLYPTDADGGYVTMSRDRLFASDRGVDIALSWTFPGPGSRAIGVALRNPVGAIYSESDFQTNATRASWVTGHRFALPDGETANALAGNWAVEVALDGKPVGRRTFIFDARNVRLRTAARVLIVQGSNDAEAGAGDWMWTHQAAVLENIQAAHTVLGIALRDELVRRFPRVDGPVPSTTAGDATILIRTKLAISPNSSVGSRATLEVVHLPTRTSRTFQFRSTAGTDQVTGGVYFGVAAADLAFQAVASEEFIGHLMSATQATPE